MIKTAIASKFVKWDIPKLDTLKGSKVYQLREKVNIGKKLSRDEKNWIAEKVNRNSYFKNAIPLRWVLKFDFSGFAEQKNPILAQCVPMIVKISEYIARFRYISFFL